MSRVASSERIAAVEAIASTLAGMAPGEVLPYMRLHNLMGGDRSLLYRARKQVEASHGYVFEAVHGVGVKRLAQCKVIVEAFIVSTERSARRVEDKVANAQIKDGERMTRTEKAELNTRMATLAVIRDAAKFIKS
jgi:hypothetical protein